MYEAHYTYENGKWTAVWSWREKWSSTSNELTLKQVLLPKEKPTEEEEAEIEKTIETLKEWKSKSTTLQK